MEYLKLLKESFLGVLDWTFKQIFLEVPIHQNYFWGLIIISFLVWTLELIFPWRKKQKKIRLDFWLDVFYMFFNFFVFSIVINGFYEIFNKLMNDLFNLNISKTQLINYAAQLGSDCPFFVYDNPCLAKGRGEILEPIQCDLSKYSVVLVHPGIHVSTAWAFGQLNPHKKSNSIATIVQQDIHTWKDELINDFEAPIFKAYPLIASLKEYLYQEGAIYASMSGSGSSLFGIFPKDKTIVAPSFAPSIRIDTI